VGGHWTAGTRMGALGWTLCAIQSGMLYCVSVGWLVGMIHRGCYKAIVIRRQTTVNSPRYMGSHLTAQYACAFWYSNSSPTLTILITHTPLVSPSAYPVDHTPHTEQLINPTILAPLASPKPLNIPLTSASITPHSPLAFPRLGACVYKRVQSMRTRSVVGLMGYGMLYGYR
jgi:hypothetical protein